MTIDTTTAFCSHFGVFPSLTHTQSQCFLRKKLASLATPRRLPNLRTATVCKGNAANTPNQVREKKEGDLILTRRSLLVDIRQKPSTQYKMTCQLSQLDLEDDVQDASAASVSVIVHPVGRHFRVRGLVISGLLLECDRCLKQYNSTSTGSFEVWLSASGAQHVSGLTDEQTRSLEAVEDFSSSEAAVDLAPHVRDAILLSTPSKKLCSAECRGIKPFGDNINVCYGDKADEVASIPRGQGLFDSVPSEQLALLRRKLES